MDTADTSSTVREGVRRNAEIALRRHNGESVELWLWIVVAGFFSLPFWFDLADQLFFYREYRPSLTIFKLFSNHFSAFAVSIAVLIFPALFKQIFGELPFAMLRDFRSRTRTYVFTDENQGLKRPDESKSLDYRSSDSVIVTGPFDEPRSVPIAMSSSLTFEKKLAIDVAENLDPRQLLALFVERSSSLARNIYTRAGVYLLVGVMIAFIGLGFFYIRTVNMPDAKDDIERVLALLPGFGILFFIEFVALFFLRQYRSAMDEFRYFDTVARSREENLVVLKMFAENKAIVPAADVIKMMNIEAGPAKLGKDETTEILESRRMQRDEIVVLERMIEALSSVRGKVEEGAKRKK